MGCVNFQWARMVNPVMAAEVATEIAAINRGAAKKPSELFDVARALRAAGQTDPAKMHVVVLPFSLSQGTDGKSALVEMRTLLFRSVEFLSREEK